MPLPSALQDDADPITIMRAKLVTALRLLNTDTVRALASEERLPVVQLVESTSCSSWSRSWSGC